MYVVAEVTEENARRGKQPAASMVPFTPDVMRWMLVGWVVSRTRKTAQAKAELILAAPGRHPVHVGSATAPNPKIIPSCSPEKNQEKWVLKFAAN